MKASPNHQLNMFSNVLLERSRLLHMNSLKMRILRWKDKNQGKIRKGSPISTPVVFLPQPFSQLSSHPMR